MADSWEYFIVKHAVGFNSNVERLEDDLNALGAQGWEAVSMTGDKNTSYVLLKRPIR